MAVALVASRPDMEKHLTSFLGALLVSAVALHGETSLKDVLAKIEPATAKPIDTTTAFTDSPRYSSLVAMTQASCTSGHLNSSSSTSLGHTL